jgi:hypothetical protein
MEQGGSNEQLVQVVVGHGTKQKNNNNKIWRFFRYYIKIINTAPVGTAVLEL